MVFTFNVFRCRIPLDTTFPDDAFELLHVDRLGGSHARSLDVQLLPRTPEGSTTQRCGVDCRLT